ncbi:MAG: hypothetical protein RSA95_01460 [Citrobacter sp.]|uniref:Catalase n=1 Tax=Citrobacter tructae TaxID=2562449 RepID=A0ABX5T3K7_9ENTR|nr:hypothetical protein [Citrobacter tructae]QBX80093.1 hypothetical protein E4Z61_06870 [Citrobacter tructae]
MPQNCPSSNWQEVVENGEQELFEGFAREFEVRQQKNALNTGCPVRRGFHTKLHTGVVAEFHVLPNLPKEARFGVFSESQIFPAIVRFSNGEPIPHKDTHPEPRGIAIKLLGVHGRKLLQGQEDAVTQDFLATSHSVTSTVRNIRQFMAFIRAADNRVKLPFALAREIGLAESMRILTALVKTVLFSKVHSMVTEQYSSTAPIKLGPFAIKFTIQPSEGTKPTESRFLASNFLRDELADRLRNGDVKLDFLVQFFIDESRTPIEDTSVAWKPEHSSFVKVAHVLIPQCDLDTPESLTLSETVDKLSFSPWHSIEEHRPLGNVMRARKIVYLASSALRGHSPEPTDLPR